MIDYSEPLFRPPSEADSLILQATIGCSYNKCTFCGMYRQKQFRIRPFEDLQAEIAVARERLGSVRKIFLADGDALIIRTSSLHRLLDELNRVFPQLRRISLYASPQSIRIKSVEEMSELREAGLSLYYLGVESGHDEVLKRLSKGVNAEEMIECGKRVSAAGVKLSTMILLGAGGRDLSLQHARESARVINAMQPRFVSTLVMTPVEGTPLMEEDLRGAFDHLDPVELARELRAFIAGLDLQRTIFRSNHASNHLALRATFPKDKSRVLAALDSAIEHPELTAYRPNQLRRL
jgi:radical SAM superfamily enzyme YgiQ (UPF0313 family)